MKSALTWVLSVCKSQLGIFKHWRLILLVLGSIWCAVLHYENVHLKTIAEYSEKRAQQAEHTLSSVLKNQKVVQDEENKLEKKKEVITHDAEKAKHNVHSDVKLSDANSLLLQEYARTINSRYTNNTK